MPKLSLWPPIYKYQRSVYSRLTKRINPDRHISKGQSAENIQNLLKQLSATKYSYREAQKHLCQIIKKKRRRKNQTRQNHKPFVPVVVVTAIHTADQDLMTDLQSALPGEKLFELQDLKSFCTCVSTTKSKWLCPSSHCKRWVWSGFRHVHNNHSRLKKFLQCYLHPSLDTSILAQSKWTYFQTVGQVYVWQVHNI